MSDSTKEVIRDNQGRWPKGVSGNPKGRPLGAKNKITALKQDLELAIREGLQKNDINAIVVSMIAEAQNGNVAAAKLILDKVLSSAKVDEDVNESGNKIQITIENFTVQPEKEDGDIFEGEIVDQEETS